MNAKLTGGKVAAPIYHFRRSVPVSRASPLPQPISRPEIVAGIVKRSTWLSGAGRYPTWVLPDTGHRTHELTFLRKVHGSLYPLHVAVANPWRFPKGCPASLSRLSRALCGAVLRGWGKMLRMAARHKVAVPSVQYTLCQAFFIPSIISKHLWIIFYGLIANFAATAQQVLLNSIHLYPVRSMV